MLQSQYFLMRAISEQRIEEIGDLIKQRVEVSHCEYTSADEAWESFKDVYFDGNEDAASSFAGDKSACQFSKLFHLYE